MCLLVVSSGRVYIQNSAIKILRKCLRASQGSKYKLIVKSYFTDILECTVSVATGQLFPTSLAPNQKLSSPHSCLKSRLKLTMFFDFWLGASQLLVDNEMVWG